MRRLLLPLLAAIAAVPLLGADGCLDTFWGHGGSAIGYTCGFVLRLERAGWQAGTRIEGTTGKGRTPFSCTVGGPGEASGCDRDDVVVEWWGDVTLRFDSLPKTVDLTVREGDRVLLAETFRPDYETTEPAGEGCGKCTRADAERRLEPAAARCDRDGGCPCVPEDGCRCRPDPYLPWPWAACPAGHVPPSECVSVVCPCTGTPPRCTADPGAPGRPWQVAAVCAEGEWTCPDPHFPNETR